MSETVVPSIPRVSQKPADLERVLRAVKEIIEVREGLRGDILDRFVTYRDLVDYLRNDESVAASIATDIKLLDTDQSNYLSLKWNEDDTSNRILNFLVHGGDRSLSLYENLTVADGHDVTLQALGQANQLTLNESFTIGDGHGGTLTFSAADKTLTVEDDTNVNQDLTTDASPGFANLSLGTGELTAGSINRAAGTLTLEIGGTAVVSIASASVTLAQTLLLSDCVNAEADVDKFLVLDGSNNVDYRTGAEVLSDIDAAASNHTHDGDTLQLDGVNSDGGAFSFTTSGDTTFNHDLIINLAAGDPEVTFQRGGVFKGRLYYTHANTRMQLTGPDGVASIYINSAGAIKASSNGGQDITLDSIASINLEAAGGVVNSDTDVVLADGAVYSTHDSDDTSLFHRAMIGFIGKGNDAGLQHRALDLDGTNYAIYQGNLGSTYINCSTGKNIYFRRNDANITNLDELDDLTDGGETALHIHDDRYYTEGEVDALIAGCASDLDDLSDVTISGPADLDLLQYDAYSGQWIDQSLSEAGVAAAATTITTTEGLQGGGDLSANRTFKADISGLAADGAPDSASDYVMTYDADAAVHKKVLLDNLPGGGAAGHAFKTITGITNDVVAEMAADTLTLSSANNRLTIVGTAATDTITFTLVETNIDHDNLASRTHNGDTLQLDGVNSNGGAFSFTTSGDITFNSVKLKGLAEPTLASDAATKNYVDNAVGVGGHTHDGETLQFDGVNSNGGAFSFTTSGTLTFSNTVALSTCANAGAASDKILVLDGSNNVDYRSRANLLADLSGQAGAAFDWNSQGLTGIASLNVGAFANLPSDEDLVGYWSFNDGSGSVAVDNSGNGNDGTLVNMEEADWVDGVAGGALDFDGTDDFVATGCTPPKPVSLSAWVKLDSYPSGEPPNTVSYILRCGQALYFDILTSGKVRFFMYDGAYNDLISNTILNTDQWYHVVAIWDGTTGADSQKIYIDGELDNSNAAHGANYDSDANVFTIGAQSGYSHLDGLIDEPRIYSRALSEHEVKALYLYPAGSGTRVINAQQMEFRGDIDIEDHDASTVGLKLAGTLITATATEINSLDGITVAGTSIIQAADAAAQLALLSGQSGAAFDWNSQNLTGLGTLASAAGTLTIDQTNSLSDFELDSHLHDGETLEADGINSDGGAFSFTTSGQVTFSENIQASEIGAGVAPSYHLHVVKDAENDERHSMLLDDNMDITSSGTYYKRSVFLRIDINKGGNQAANNAGYNRALQIGHLVRENAGTLSEVTGQYIDVGSYGSGGADVSCTITTLQGLYISLFRRASTTITNAYGLYLDAYDTIAGAYGIYENIGQLNYFAGNVGIGTNSPGDKLVVDGGSLDIDDHDGAANGLKLAGTLITATATEINSLDGITVAGTSIIQAADAAAQLALLSGQAGAAFDWNAQGLADHGYLSHIYHTEYHRVIRNPGGGHFYERAANCTGAIKITLPVSWNRSMIYVIVRGREHEENGSWEVYCGGHLYTSATSWATEFAEVRSGGSPPFTRVRFGHDGSKCCIVLGETDSDFDYPYIWIEEVGIFHAGADDGWETGWTIEDKQTDLSGITFTGDITNQSWNQLNDGSGSGLDADLWDGNEFADYLDQAVKTTSSPSFVSCSLGTGELTAGSINRASGTLTLEIGGVAKLSIASSSVTVAPTLILSTCAAAGSDVNKFLVLDGSDNIDYRTGAQVLSDLSGDAGAAFSWNSQNLTSVGNIGAGTNELTIGSINRASGSLTLEIGGTAVITIASGSVSIAQPTTVPDHGAAATDQVINVCYGTGDPPAANTTTIGALYVKYTA